jgi:tripartite-type tricarboxylate transporter receptor subunit TctC
MNNHWFRLTAGALASAFAFTASAQTFPTKPIKIVVPFGAGGVADLTARSLAQRLAEQYGQGVVVENRPGAGGFAAADAVVKAEPDGHTWLLISNGTAVSAGLFKSPQVEADRDLAPVSLMAAFDLALVVSAESKFQSLADVSAFAKQNPGKLNVGSINIGSTQHLSAELVKFALGWDAQVVPFNGTPAVVTALRGGTVDVAVEILGPIMGQITGKALRPIALLGERRASALPDVPTLGESVKDAPKIASWNGIALSARTPPALVQKISKDVQAALATPAVQTRFRELNVEPLPSTPEQASAHLKSEIRRWSEVIRKANVPQQ